MDGKAAHSYVTPVKSMAGKEIVTIEGLSGAWGQTGITPEVPLIYMHCRIRVADYAKWKERMDADAKAQRDAGMYLKYLWRGAEDPNRAFFILKVHDMEKARALLNPGDAA